MTGCRGHWDFISQLTPLLFVRQLPGCGGKDSWSQLSYTGFFRLAGLKTIHLYLIKHYSFTSARVIWCPQHIFWVGHMYINVKRSVEHQQILNAIFAFAWSCSVGLHRYLQSSLENRLNFMVLTLHPALKKKYFSAKLWKEGWLHHWRQTLRERARKAPEAVIFRRRNSANYLPWIWWAAETKIQFQPSLLVHGSSNPVSRC